MKKGNAVFFTTILLMSAVFTLLLFVSRFTKENISNFRIKDREVKVEIVTGSKAQQKGLGGRKSLCENCGMLFVFPERKKTSFWMKDMNFDLDIIWVADSKISYISKNADHSSLERMNPGTPSDMVLELNAGFCDKYGVKIGDEALLE